MAEGGNFRDHQLVSMLDSGVLNYLLNSSFCIYAFIYLEVFKTLQRNLLIIQSTVRIKSQMKLSRVWKVLGVKINVRPCASAVFHTRYPKVYILKNGQSKWLSFRECSKAQRALFSPQGRVGVFPWLWSAPFEDLPPYFSFLNACGLWCDVANQRILFVMKWVGGGVSNMLLIPLVWFE